MSLEKKLTPQHSIPTPEALEKEAKLLEQVPEKPDPKKEIEYTFPFAYVDGSGKKWEGTFTHRVPNLSQRDQIDFIAARMKAGMPVEQWAIAAVERHYMMAHLQICLVDKPDWAKDLTQLHDATILEKLYAEVASHEATFLGLGQSQESGA